MFSLLIFIGLLCAMILLPLALRFRLALWSSLLQIYTIPVFGFYPSIAMISNASLVTGVFRYKRNMLHRPAIFYAGLLGIQCLSLLWSPNLHLGVTTIIYEIPFLLLSITAYEVALTNPTRLVSMLKIYSVFTLIPIALALFLRLRFDLDVDFLESLFAKTTINPNTLIQNRLVPVHIPGYVFLDHVMNQPMRIGRWVDKPRTMMINPNTLSAYLGICALVFYGIGQYCHSTWLKFIGILNWLAIFIVLSFSAMTLAIALPLIIACIYAHASSKEIVGLKTKAFVSYTMLILLLFCILVFMLHPAMFNIIVHKFDARLALWKVAALFFSKHLYMGLGFGGWEINYATYRLIAPSQYLQPNYPPHNTFIQLWAQSGIIAPLLALAFILSLFRLIWHTYQRLAAKNEKLLTLCIAGAFFWVLLQGMGENWGLVGDIHIQPVLASALGLLAGLYHRYAGPK